MQTILVRMYLFGYRLIDSLLRLCRVFYCGMWLGILSDSALRQIVELHYEKSSTYTDDCYNNRGLFAWEETALRQHFSDCHTVYVVGAGGGREVLGLRRLGYSAEGCECNPKLVRYANGLFERERMDAKMSLAPPDECAALVGTYDGVVIGWSAYSHINGRHRRVALLQTLREHMDEASPILISFLSRNPRANPVSMTLVVRTANLIRRLIHRQLLTPGDMLNPMFVHKFAMKEITSELEAGGFRMICSLPGDSSTTAVVACAI